MATLPRGSARFQADRVDVWPLRRLRRRALLRYMHVARLPALFLTLLLPLCACSRHTRQWALPLSDRDRNEIEVVGVLTNLYSPNLAPCDGNADQTREYLQEEVRVAERLKDNLIEALNRGRPGMPLFIRDDRADSVWADLGISPVYRLNLLRTRWPEVDAVLAVDLEIELHCEALEVARFGQNVPSLTAHAYMVRLHDLVVIANKEHSARALSYSSRLIDAADILGSLDSVTDELVSDLRKYLLKGRPGSAARSSRP